MALVMRVAWRALHALVVVGWLVGCGGPPAVKDRSSPADSDTGGTTDTHDSNSHDSETGQESGESGQESSESGEDSETGHDSESGGGETGDVGPVEMALDDVGVKLVGENAYDALGGYRIAVAGVGDVDGNGSPDVMVGMPASARGGELGGAAFLLAAPIDRDVDLGDATAIVEGSGAEQLGYGLAAAGDVDRDGYDDVLIGATDFDDGLDEMEGQAYLFSGPLLGPISTSSATATLHGEEVGVDFAYETQTGASLSSAGDVNGDGYPDLLVGAYGYLGAAGVAYLLPGPVSGTIELSSVAWRLEGVVYGGSRVGTSVDDAGDIDGDGLDDVVIGAPGYDGIAAVVFTELDVTASPVLSDATATITQSGTFAYAGWASQGGGDLDQDGYADLLITDSATLGDGTTVGAVAVILGPVVGDVDLATAAARIYDPDSINGFAASMVGISNNDGSPPSVVVGAIDDWPTGTGAAFVFRGPFLGALTVDDASTRLVGDGDDEAGFVVADANDVDGDGLGDLLVGSPRDDDGGEDAGAAWLVLGSSLP